MSPTIIFRFPAADGSVLEINVPKKDIVDPVFKRQSDRRAKAMVETFGKAVAEAKRRGVPLQEILPVS